MVDWFSLVVWVDGELQNVFDDDLIQCMDRDLHTNDGLIDELLISGVGWEGKMLYQLFNQL